MKSFRIMYRNSFPLLLLCGSLFADQHPQEREVLQGVKQICAQDYENADSLFSSLPVNHPAGPFFRAMILHAKMVENHDYRDPADLYRHADEADRRAKLATAGGKVAWGLFYSGSALGIKSTYEEKAGKWRACITNGMKGLSALRKCLSHAPNFHDALAGIGVYHYWKGRVLRYLDWLPLMEDHREKGIKQLTIAMNRGKYLSHAARFSLVWAYYKEGDYRQSLELCRQFLQSYPANTIFLRARADVHYKTKQWDSACDDYRLLLTKLRDNPTSTGIEEIECQHKFAVALKEAGRTSHAEQAFENLLTMPAPDWWEKSDFLRDNASRQLKLLRGE